jgi:hypothetical protein
MRCAKCGRFVSLGDPCVARYPEGVCEFKMDIVEVSSTSLHWGLEDKPAPLWLRILRGLKAIICLRGGD